MIEEKTKELYEAPQALLMSLAKSQSLLVSFSIGGDFEDIGEDDNEW